MRLALLVSLLCTLAFVAFANDLSSPKMPSGATDDAQELLHALDVADALNPQSVLVLEALNNGNVECAICILEAEVDLAIESAEARLRDDPTETMQETLKLPLEMLKTYRERNPWDGSKCPDGVCRTPK